MTVHFNDFDLENNYDWVYVYDGRSDSAPLLGQFTGTSVPHDLTSSNSDADMYVKFTSDGSVSGDGFHFVMSCTSSTNNCRYANDGQCDEPAYCRWGTDCSDCHNCAGHRRLEHGLPNATFAGENQDHDALTLP